MSIIDNALAQKLGKWIEQHPQEADAYYKERRELVGKFTSKEISFEEFKNQSVYLKEKYHFMEP